MRPASGNVSILHGTESPAGRCISMRSSGFGLMVLFILAVATAALVLGSRHAGKVEMHDFVAQPPTQTR
jgi:hypothetical protein